MRNSEKGKMSTGRHKTWLPLSQNAARDMKRTSSPAKSPTKTKNDKDKFKRQTSKLSKRPSFPAAIKNICFFDHIFSGPLSRCPKQTFPDSSHIGQQCLRDSSSSVDEPNKVISFFSSFGIFGKSLSLEKSL